MFAERKNTNTHTVTEWESVFCVAMLTVHRKACKHAQIHELIEGERTKCARWRRATNRNTTIGRQWQRERTNSEARALHKSTLNWAKQRAHNILSNKHRMREIGRERTSKCETRESRMRRCCALNTQFIRLSDTFWQCQQYRRTNQSLYSTVAARNGILSTAEYSLTVGYSKRKYFREKLFY